MASRPSPDAGEAGVDGLILVDLPLEHAGEIDRQLREHGMHLIRMSAPTSRIPGWRYATRAVCLSHHAGRHDRGRAAGRGPHRPRWPRCARIRACRWRRVSACAHQSRPGWWAGMPTWWRSVPGWPRCWPSAACPARWRKCGCWPAPCGSRGWPARHAGRPRTRQERARRRRRAVGVHAVVAHVRVGNPARLAAAGDRSRRPGTAGSPDRWRSRRSSRCAVPGRPGSSGPASPAGTARRPAAAEGEQAGLVGQVGGVVALFHIALAEAVVADRDAEPDDELIMPAKFSSQI